MINRVVLIGRLTKDVDVRKTQTGLSVASFTVACDRQRSRQDANSQQQAADFINCVAWRQSADFLGSYARKGALVGVEGRLQSRSYDDRDGKRVFVTEVVCDNVQLLESKSVSESRRNSTSSFGAVDNSGYQSAPEPVYTRNPEPQKTGNTSQNSYEGPSLDISSDDLPF